PACIPPAVLLAQLAPAGSEFQVNTHTTSSQSTYRQAVAAAANGDFVVVWTSNQDGANDNVFGQRYASSGAMLGTEFRVNTHTTSYQSSAAVAAAGDGNFVVVWESYLQDGDGYGIFAQRYAGSGSPVGTEFQVNTYTIGYQDTPTVATASNGDFVVAWDSGYQDGSYAGVFAQRYASGGSRLGTEFQVNTYTTYEQEAPAVAMAGNGQFVAVWVRLQDGDGSGIFGQRYASSGSALGTEFQANTYTTSYQRAPSVAVADDGDFVVAWDSRGQDGDSDGVFGQRYASS